MVLLVKYDKVNTVIDMYNMGDWVVYDGEGDRLS
jgi:hypothetical protein